MFRATQDNGSPRNVSSVPRVNARRKPVVFGPSVPEGIYGEDVDGLAVEIQRISDLEVGKRAGSAVRSVYAAAGQLPELQRCVEHRQEALVDLGAQPERRPISIVAPGWRRREPTPSGCVRMRVSTPLTFTVHSKSDMLVRWWTAGIPHFTEWCVVLTRIRTQPEGVGSRRRQPGCNDRNGTPPRAARPGLTSASWRCSDAALELRKLPGGSVDEPHR